MMKILQVNVKLIKIIQMVQNPTLVNNFDQFCINSDCFSFISQQLIQVVKMSQDLESRNQQEIYHVINQHMWDISLGNYGQDNDRQDSFNYLREIEDVEIKSIFNQGSNSLMDQLQLDFSSTGKGIQQKKDTIDSDKGGMNEEDREGKRLDGNVKNLPQNISSTGQTIAPRILTRKKKPNKKEIKQTKKRLDLLLTQYEAKNNQLIIVFLYLFFIKQKAGSSQFQQMKLELLRYIQKRTLQADKYKNREEKDKMMERLQIHKRLILIFFENQTSYVDIQLLKTIGSPLFTGRQKTGINKSLNKIATLQETIFNERKSYQQQQSLIKSSNHFLTRNE